MPELFIVQVKQNKRWFTTIWTGHIPVTKRSRQEIDYETGKKLSYTGKPVSKRSAVAAMKKAQKRFPESEYRIKEVGALV